MMVVMYDGWQVDGLAERVADKLDGPLTVAQLMRRLRQDPATRRVSRTAVERLLHDDPRFVADGGDVRCRWERVAPRPVTPLVSDPAGREPVVPAVRTLGLRRWQALAFAAWAEAGCRGVVEAVTGTGKTRLGFAAVAALAAHGARTLVIVPTVELQDQWVTAVRRHMSGLRVGRLGGGGADDLHERDMVVATPHSAAALPVDLPVGRAGLLIADEAHRYGAPTWAAALRDLFDARLALTATYERADDGVEDHLTPYFGGVVFTYTFTDAAAERMISPFEVGFVPVGLSDGERSAYRDADRRVAAARRTLLDAGLPSRPEEMTAAAARAASHRDHRAHRAARAYLSAVAARRHVAANAAGKLSLLRTVASALGGHRTLVFTDTVSQAAAAVTVLRSEGVTAAAVHGELTRDQRRGRMGAFRAGHLDVLAAPRVLDEGIDVPDADTAVVLAAFRTRRQMIQRLGRVLRVGPSDQHARLLVTYAAGTREDPRRGAHRQFLDDVAAAAEQIITFPDQSDVTSWLS